MTLQTKILIGVVVAGIAGYALFIRQIGKTGEERERARQANKRAEESLLREQGAIARADSFQVLHKQLFETSQRREVYVDSMIAELDRFGKKIVFVRQYENDSIVGSIDLSRQHKLFTEWIAAAKESDNN